MEFAAYCGDFHVFYLLCRIFATYYIAKLPRLIKGELDVILTLPLDRAPQAGSLLPFSIREEALLLY